MKVFTWGELKGPIISSKTFIEEEAAIYLFQDCGILHEKSFPS